MCTSKGNFSASTSRSPDETICHGGREATTRAQVFVLLSGRFGCRLVMFVCSGRSGQTVIKHAGFMGLGKQVCGGEVGSGWVGMANWVGES